MSKIVISNIEEYTIYGCRVWFDKRDGKYRTDIGGKVVEKDSYSDMAYHINMVQSNPCPPCLGTIR